MAELGETAGGVVQEVVYENQDDVVEKAQDLVGTLTDLAVDSVEDAIQDAKDTSDDIELLNQATPLETTLLEEDNSALSTAIWSAVGIAAAGAMLVAFSKKSTKAVKIDTNEPLL